MAYTNIFVAKCTRSLYNPISWVVFLTKQTVAMEMDGQTKQGHVCGSTEIVRLSA